jgi:hypothetical protein
MFLNRPMHHWTRLDTTGSNIFFTMANLFPWWSR